MQINVLLKYYSIKYYYIILKINTHFIRKLYQILQILNQTDLIWKLVKKLSLNIYFRNNLIYMKIFF